MSKDTGIHWCDDSVNPTSGCDGCELWLPGQGGTCYAGNFHETRLAKALPLLYDPVFTNVRLIPGRMAKAVRCMDLAGRSRPEKPWLNNLRRKIFVGDLGDIFSAAVPFDYLKREIIDVAYNKDGSRHDLLLLTKQPQREAQFANWLMTQGVSWPENVWVGTSITNRASLPRIKHLVQIPASHRFLSLEPLIGDPELTATQLHGIDWIIIGGESDQGSHPGRPFQVGWAEQVINLGRQTGVAVFVKQLGSHPVSSRPLTLTDKHGGDWENWEPALRVRQMPFTCR
jgi:protein gp37